MKKQLLCASALLLVQQFSYSQCSMTGLPSGMCPSESAVTLTGIPGGGTFTGDGISGNTFDPAVAGTGSHTITYTVNGINYTIDQSGTFNPLPSVGTSLLLGDDEVSTNLPIGFTFSFFGTPYTDFYISSNGFITFDPLAGSGCCSGSILPANDAVNNVIAFAWNDLYPPAGGSISYETVGVAPNRQLLVNFNAINHCCSAGPTNTVQVILYETSNIIEIHTTELTDDGSPITQGIENADGTVGYTVAGRNSANFTLTNDYVAFIPGGACVSTQTVDVNGIEYSASAYCSNADSPTPVITGPTGGTFSSTVGLVIDPALGSIDIANSTPGTYTVNYEVALSTTATTYMVDQTGTFNPIPSVGTALTLGDDEVSTNLPIGFSFDFFGVTYTDFYVSSNGFITFDGASGDGCCSGSTIPSFDAVNNVIAFAWNDLYPPGGGSITYETIGTAPNRQLLVNFNAINHCCSAGPSNTGQIILNETSNIIEIHTTEITDDGSTITQGIENADGTIGYFASGRNSANFTLNNDYVAFIPYIPTCSVSFDVTINSPLSGSAVITDESTSNNGAIDFIPGGGTPAYNYVWSGPNAFSATSEDITGLGAGTYSVIVSDASGCQSTFTFEVANVSGIVEMDGVLYTIYPNPTTGVFTISGENTANSVALEIINTAGEVLFEEKMIENVKSFDLSSFAKGTYFVRIKSEQELKTIKVVLK